MIITPLGKYALRMQLGDTSWVINPHPKQSKVGSQLVIATSLADEVHAVEQAQYGETEPFVVDGPGAYEFGGIHINGALATHTELGDHISTAYRFELDDMSVAVCGPGVMQKSGLEPAVIELIAEPDILIVSFGPDARASDLAALVVMCGPRIVIPTGFSGIKDPVFDAFSKELAKSAPVVTDKFTVKRRDLDGKQQEIVALVA